MSVLHSVHVKDGQMHHWAIYFDKRKQVTNPPNLSYSCFLIEFSTFYLQNKFSAEALILLTDIQIKLS